MKVPSAVPMSRKEAREIAAAVRDALPVRIRQKLKAVDVCPKLHQGMLTLRVYAVNQTAEDPEPFVFMAEEI